MLDITAFRVIKKKIWTQNRDQTENLLEFQDTTVEPSAYGHTPKYPYYL